APFSLTVGLQCWSCGDYSCSSQTSVNCSSGQTLCVSRYYRGNFTYGNYSYNQTYKGCAFSSDCTAAGSEFVSYIYGSKSYVSNTTCCDTDNCNYMTANGTKRFKTLGKFTVGLIWRGTGDEGQDPEAECAAQRG
uniref:UPAR/Ly6 domain-containing protein n=1 Tax=Periophthalmus magnuspinnatus TaxID=409849 RepID=A0A3B3ZLX9_9GOBI